MSDAVVWWAKATDFVVSICCVSGGCDKSEVVDWFLFFESVGRFI